MMTSHAQRPLRLGGGTLPVVGRARIYLCGITPYDTTHLGHASVFVWTDLAARVLRTTGVEVELCRNVTDVDDALTAAAQLAGADHDRFAAVQKFHFDRDMGALGVAAPAHEPRVHNHVSGVIALVSTLIGAHAAYEQGGTVYFHGEHVAPAAGVPPEEALALSAEYGDDPADPAKHDPMDVPIWVRSTGGEPAWPSPWGPGRPGWHAGCAAMALSVLGSAVDLHAGGADLHFPHHAFQSALAQATTGVAPFARRCMQVGIVQVDGAKMAKSSGNLVLVDDLITRTSAPVVRLMLLSRHWRDSWDYTPAELDAAGERLERLYAAAARTGGSTEAAEVAVHAALRDDLDVPTVLDLAETEGGTAARTAMRLLGLT